MTRFWFAFLFVSLTGAVASKKPAAEVPDGVVSVEYVAELGYLTGAVPPKNTPEQAWLSVTVRRSFPPGSQMKLPVKLIRVTDSTDASYPLIGIACRWKSKDALVYRIVKGEPIPTEVPKGPVRQGERIRLNGGWSTLFQEEGGELKPAGSAFCEDGDIKKMLLTLTRDKESGEDRIEFLKSPLTLHYWFQVPKAAQELQLRFGSEEPVALAVK
jgi:hypothetical protein